MSENAILTGSQVYGIPTDGSDIDVVVLMSEEHIKRLVAASQGCCDECLCQYPDAATFRFGKLNLIAVSNLIAFEVWRDATKALLARAPVSREQAVEVIARCLASAGLPD